MNGRRLDARGSSHRSVSLVVALSLAATGLAVVPTFVGAASAAPVTLAPSADATVAEDSPATNAGGAAALGVDGDPRTEAYVRFPAAGVSGPVARATLRLFVTDPTKDAPAVHTAPTAWTETTLTWANRPGRGAVAVADEGAASAGAWLEYDVTGAVTPNGPSGFVLVPEMGDGIDVNSREASGNRPQLVVETGGAPGAAVTFSPRADAQVHEDDPGANLGAETGLGTRQGPGTRIETYLRFDVAGLAGPPARATLRLFVTGSSDDGPAVRAAGGDWSESAVSWANRPAATGAVLDDLGAVERGWVDLDVTPLVSRAGAMNLVLGGGSADAAWFRSREATPAERPQLVVETSAGPTSPPPTVPTTMPTTTTTTTTRPPGPTTTTTRPPARCDDRWDDARNIGELPHGRAEMSGLAASSRHPGWGWGIRDSGNPAALYSFRPGSGGSRAVAIDEFLVPGAANSDWEDVVYTRGAGGAGVLWVLENVGNGHGGVRRIYQVAEPDPDNPGLATLLGRYDWAYPDAQYNTETMFVFDGDLVVVSKTSPSRVYRFETGLRSGTLNRPSYVGTLPTGSNLSVGSVSPDGRFLAVASHNNLHVYENRGSLTDLGGLIADPPVFSDRLPDDNREAGGFFPAGSCDIVLVAESKNVWRSSQ